MQELSKIKEFSGLVSQAAKLGKKSITLDYNQSVALMHEINSLLITATEKLSIDQSKTASSKLDGGGFKN
jgi:hypothetical protein